MIKIATDISIDEKEIKMDFIRASGPGGQNVNKVASAVQLRFDVYGSPSLPDDVRKRLILMARNRINEDGILIIKAGRFRTQNHNRQDAIDRLIDLIYKSTIKPKKRLKTKPSVASKRRMMEDKRRRSKRKRMRGPIRNIED
ncbi:MAG: alternative ribosome rescue aminoacyl-tRNA hydrolase ArfB [Desulfobacterales bacterium]